MSKGVLEALFFLGVLAFVASLPMIIRSQWMKVSVGCFFLTVAFMLFYGAIPSAMISWTDNWDLVKNHSGGAAFGPRIRDAVVMGYHGAIVTATFFGFALYQRLHPVNADADEGKRDPGGYR
jgi:hypothetical protein